MLAQSLFDLPFVAQLNPVATTAVTSASLWADRVVVNGGTRPTDSTITAMNTFYNSLVSSGIDGKMISVCCFVPDNLTASITPLIKKFGNDPWTNSGFGFLESNVSSNGLTDIHSASYLKTGVNPVACYANADDAGFTIYSKSPTHFSNARLVAIDIGSNFAGLYMDGTHVDFAAYSNNGWSLEGIITGSVNDFIFSSVSKTNINSLNIYQANSSIGFVNLATGSTGPTTRPNLDLWLNCENINNSATNFPVQECIYSFTAIHNGLTDTETQNFYNAVQTLRISLGGGYS